MKIVRVVGGLDPAFGGPSVSSLTSCIATQRAGIVNLFALPVDPDVAADVEQRLALLREEGIEVKSFPLGRVCSSKCRDWGISDELIRWLALVARSVDGVHAHGAWTFTTLCGLAIAKVSRRPAVLTPHEAMTDFDIAKSRPAKRLAKRLLRAVYLNAFDTVVVASTLEARDSRTHWMRARLVVIPHAVEVSPAATRTQAPRRGPALRIGYLGRFDPKKNLDLLITVVASLGNSVVLEVGGDGPRGLRDSLIALAHELNVDQRVTWLGFVSEEEKPSFFASLDLLVMPSTYESFGMAAAEALAHGVPVMVSPSTGIADIVRRYSCGYVVPATEHKLVAALEGLLVSRNELTEKGKRAADAAQNELSLACHGRRLRFEYEHLLASSGRRAPLARERNVRSSG
jgi:glycosyltransferase involved in cell wall biosynthesis